MPLGLKRLAGLPARDGEAIPAAASFEVFDVTSSGPAGQQGIGSSVRIRGSNRFVELAPNATWSRPLRALHDGKGYTTFSLHVSLGTIVDVGGALISLQPGAEDALPAVVAGVEGTGGLEWKSLGYGVEVRPFDGKPMAMLAAITVHTDAKAGTWWVSVRDHLLAYDLPLETGDSRAPRSIGVTAGTHGAWISGLACSDVNPLFEDDNHNAVADDFEREMFGELLRTGASLEARQALEQAWRERQYEQPQVFQFELPVPDPPSLEERQRMQGQSVPGHPSSILIDTTLN